MRNYDENLNENRQLLGYDGYDKSEIYDGDDIVRYKGLMYHRENFIQMNLDGHGNLIEENEE